jgi:hypothetical protein
MLSELELGEEKARNAKLFQEFVDLVPPEAVEGKVRAYLLQLTTNEFAAGLGNPKEVLNLMADEHAIDAETQRRLREEVETLLADAAAGTVQLQQETVDAETQHAREEICRLWLDLLLLALHTLGTDELVLTNSLKPVKPPPEFSDWFQESRDSMDSNVALRRDDVAAVSELYATAVLQRTESEPLPLPGRFELSRRKAKLVIRRTT